MLEICICIWNTSRCNYMTCCSQVQYTKSKSLLSSFGGDKALTFVIFKPHTVFLINAKVHVLFVECILNMHPSPRIALSNTWTWTDITETAKLIKKTISLSYFQNLNPKWSYFLTEFYNEIYLFKKQNMYTVQKCGFLKKT